MDDAATREPTHSDAFRELDFGPWRAVVCTEFAQPFAEAMQRLGLERTRTLYDLGLEWREGGRGRTAVLSLPGIGTRLHVRPLAHGGALRHVTGSRFSSLERPLRELRVCAALARRGAPIAAAAFALGRRNGVFWQVAMGSVEIEASLDGVAFLAGERDVRRLSRAASAVGRALRRFHDLGGCHADLHIKNLLLREDDGAFRVWIVDLDRARIEDEVRARRRTRELMRLHRSLRKRRLAAALTADVQRAFLAGYFDGDDGLRRRMAATLRFERLRNGAHALFHPHRS